MQVLYKSCAGLDVHKDVIVACARVGSGRKTQRSTESFPTHTAGLLALSEWLTSRGCTHVAMEATGVYWKPVWHILEGTFELVLANASHIRNVPGRKSDVGDAEWIADLLAHGLIRSSFVPEQPVQELRDLTRTRKQLVREMSQHTLRLQKVLEDANIKVTGLISDILGVSGRAILRAMIDGESDPNALAQLARGSLREKKTRLIDGLTGMVTPHHRFMLQMHLKMVENIEAQLAEIDARIGGALEPFRHAVDLLKTIPGVGNLVAQVILAEMGADMSRFPTAGHLVSWAGLCPRSDESAGKRRSTRIRHGAPWLKTTLVQAAWAAARAKNSYLQAQYLRLKSRRGPKKAIIAVAASMLTAAFHMLRDQKPYVDLGSHHFDQVAKAHTVTRLVHRLTSLGYAVELKEAA